ncbi:MAG: response regulator, partial [Firmicutes bacterium]|nr:response regulator [Bacillota bacterium]
MYNILICDDEPDIVNALKIYLADPEYRLLEAANGRQVLEVAEREDLHLVLLDIMMP